MAVPIKQKGYSLLWLARLGNDSQVNGNNRRVRGMASNRGIIMKTFNGLYSYFCLYENLLSAFKKARKHKSLRPYVIEFASNLKENLLKLQEELIKQTYKPKPLETFTIRDPKTRKISKSDFRDRIVHHAVCNIIEPIFEKSFIYDSYANRIGKGTRKAVERLDYFKKKVSKNNTKKCFALKADIMHYFDTMDHKILIEILNKKLNGDKLIAVIKSILENYKVKHEEKGMPLGNLTSQFFANVYLNELDYFIKYELRTKYYIRYVDDFIILHDSKEQLSCYKNHINAFLKNKLSLKMHPDKTKIFSIYQGIAFLGLRIYAHHKLLKKSNIKKFNKRLKKLSAQYNSKDFGYDKIYGFLEGWIEYSKQSNSFKLRSKLLKPFEKMILSELSAKELNKYLKIKDAFKV